MLPKRPALTAAALSVRTRIWLRDHHTLAEVADVMSGSGLPLLPVCDSERRLLGTVTWIDLLAAFSSGQHPSTPVREVMNPDPPVIADYAGPEWVITEMIDAHSWCLPVIDADDRLVAVVTLPDLASVVGAAVMADSWQQITRDRGR